MFYSAQEQPLLKNVLMTCPEKWNFLLRIILLLATFQEELEESMNVSRMIKSSKPMEEAQQQIAQWQKKYKVCSKLTFSRRFSHSLKVLAHCGPVL